jgi:hypothetical protein
MLVTVTEMVSSFKTPAFSAAGPELTEVSTDLYKKALLIIIIGPMAGTSSRLPAGRPDGLLLGRFGYCFSYMEEQAAYFNLLLSFLALLALY